tara:strand:- start:523 stop:771 length:249 start_codon:yes stop_codon:yes gene_type:complete
MNYPLDKAKKQKLQISSDKPVSHSIKDEAQERRRLEVKRRFDGLQVRRNHLEDELQAIKNCLIALDRQMQNDQAYKQLSIRN